MSLMPLLSRRTGSAVALITVSLLLQAIIAWSGAGPSSSIEAVAAGARVSFSTYLGIQDTQASGIALDPQGFAYITGLSRSASFQVAPATVIPATGSPSIFVTKIDPGTGSIVYSTLIPGTAGAAVAGIAVDSQGAAYVAGTTFSGDFPVSPGAFQPRFAPGATQSVFVFKVDPAGSSVVYSTLLGGQAIQAATSIAVDGQGRAYVTGTTNSPDFPVTAGAFQTDRGSGFVAKINADGSGLDYSTLFGGSGLDSPTAISLDSFGDAYITGSAHSPDFPTTVGAFMPVKPAPASVENPFIMKLNPAGSTLIYSTFLGGTDGTHNRGNAIAAGPDGGAVVVGSTSSRDFTTLNALFGCPRGGDLLKTVDSAATFSRSENGLPAAGLTAIAADPHKGPIVYAAFGGDSHGIFKTTSAGKTWARIGDFGPSATCSVMEVDPSLGSTLYAGVSTSKQSGSDGSILKSLDGGATWAATGLDQPGLVVSGLVVDPRNHSIIYAGLAGGDEGHPGAVFKSEDAGATWTFIGIGLPPGNVQAIALDPTSSSIVYLGTTKGLFQSRDGGARWSTLIDAPIGALAIDPDDPLVLYAGIIPNASASSLEGRGNPRKRIGQGGAAAGLIKSVDGGSNWRLINKGLRFAGIVPNKILIDLNDSATLYFACSEGLFVSSNSGHRWVPTGLSGYSVRAVAQSPQGGPIYAQGNPSDDAFVTRLDATGNVVYSTYIGGLGEDQGLGVALDPGGNVFLAGTTRSRDLVTTSKALQSELGGGTDVFVTVISSSGRRILYSSYMGGSGDDLLSLTGAGGIAVDQAGNVYLAGTTLSTDFPTRNALQASLSGTPDPENPPRNAFLVKLAHPAKGQ
jgi:hypothetical protein